MKNNIRQYTIIACHPTRNIVVSTPTIPVALLNNKKYRNMSANTGSGKIKLDAGDNFTRDERKKKYIK